MLDKSKLGTRYTCFQCGTKFYDLHREVATCPECGADQAEAPVRDIKSLLSGRGRARDTDDSIPTSVDSDDVNDDDEFDDLGIDDDDDDGGDDDESGDDGGDFDDDE